MDVFDQYKHANCTLFRIPPIDTEGVTYSIENILLQAWQQGIDTNAAVESIINDSTLVDSLAQKIGENLEFQRQQYGQRITAEKEDALREHQRTREIETQALLEEIEMKKALGEKRYSSTARELETKKADYTAAQTRLEEMRARVREKLEAVGGEEGFNKLMQIDAALTGTADDDTEKPEKRKRKKTLASTLEETTYDPLEEQRKIKETQIVVHRSKFYNFASNVWDALNYRL